MDRETKHTGPNGAPGVKEALMDNQGAAFHTSEQADALAEMREATSSEETVANVQNQGESAVNQVAAFSTSEIDDALDEMGQDETPIGLDAELQLRLLRDIDRIMGKYLDSLKEVDDRFASMADGYLKQASELSNKKNPSDEDVEEVVVNLIIGHGIKVVGNIFKSIKVEKQLSNILNILANEAEAKLDILRTLRDINGMVYDVALDCYFDADTFEVATTSFNKFRLQRYIVDTNDYLIDVYYQALYNHTFTDMEIPSYYRANREMLFEVLTNPEERSSNSAKKAEERQVIKDLVDCVKNSIVNNETPNLREYIMASDAQIMAVAIDSYLDVDFNSDGESFSSEGNPAVPDKLMELSLFEGMYGEAYDHPDSSLSSFVQGNEALSDSLLHYFQAFGVKKTYDERDTLYGVNSILIAVVCALGSIVHFDLSWYWGVLIGIIGWIVAMKATPFTSWLDLCRDKTVCILRKLALDNLNRAGYTQAIDMRELASSNRKIWLYVVLGAIIGLIVPIPFGWLIGAVLGGILAAPGDEATPTDYDYTSMNLGRTWKAQTVSAIFAAYGVYLLYLLIF